MALCRQIIESKNIQLWKVIVIICGSVFIMNSSIAVFQRFGSLWSSILALLLLLFMATGICYEIIYRYLSSYSYRLIDDEIVLERSIGRGNHFVLSFKIKDIESLTLYNQRDEGQKVSRKMIFTNNASKGGWYIMKASIKGKASTLVIEPNNDFLNGLKNSAKL